MTHNDVVAKWTAVFMEELGNTVPRRHEVDVAQQALARSFANALKRRGNLTVEDVSFHRGLLQLLTATEREALVNPYTPGLGSADAPIIVSGTESAFETGNGMGLSNLALESCALSLLWLSGDGGHAPAIARFIRQEQDRPFHVHPNDFYQVQFGGRGHTWAHLARILARSLRQASPTAYLDPFSATGLGDLTYQLETSAFPHAQMPRAYGDGLPKRERFLTDMVTALRDQHCARVLWFHGGIKHRQLKPVRERIARAFWGDSASYRLTDVVVPTVKGNSATYYRVGNDGTDRLILFTPALSGAAGMPREMDDSLAEHLRPFLMRAGVSI